MPRLIEWDQVGERTYEQGIDRGVLYLRDSDGDYPEGVAWNGLISVSENPTGGEPNPHYADNMKYLNIMSKEEFEATIEAYTYPDEFAACDGSAAIADGVYLGQQSRSIFGLVYRTLIGNDIDDEAGYKLHLVYGALAAPSEKSYETINDTPEAITFSWDITTTPVSVEGYKPTAHIIIDSTKAVAADLAALELILYGTKAVEADSGASPPVVAADAVPAKLPSIQEVIDIFEDAVSG